jgi:hypothetical protein
MPSWVSESIIGTTTWSGPATTAVVAHPGINWLVNGDVSGGSSSAHTKGGSSVTDSVPTASSASHSSEFELFHLSKAASIGIVVAIAGGGLAIFVALVACCRCVFFRRRRGRDRKNKPPVVYNPVPAPAPAEQYPMEAQYGVKPGQYGGYPQQTYQQTAYGQGGYGYQGENRYS